MEKNAALYSNYAITVTLNEEYAKKSVSGQLVDSYQVLQSLIKRYIEHDGYKFYVEFTRIGTLHYHGVIHNARISDVLRRKHLFTKHLGYSLFKVCNNYEKWMEYCTKDIVIAKDVFPTISFPLVELTSIKFKNKDTILTLL